MQKKRGIRRGLTLLLAVFCAQAALALGGCASDAPEKTESGSTAVTTTEEDSRQSDTKKTTTATATASKKTSTTQKTAAAASVFCHAKDCRSCVRQPVGNEAGEEQQPE